MRNKYVNVREYPFDSQLKRMTKICLISHHRPDDPGLISFSKGAPEVIIERCTSIGGLNDNRPLTQAEKVRLQEFAEEFAQLGFRLLAFAFKPLDELPPQEEDERAWVEANLIYLGFVCLLDPARGGIKEAVEECTRAGITPIMITGDSPVTAGTIAREVGILRKGQTVHEGVEAAELPEDEFDRTAVFARVSPQHKQIIVERYQEGHRVVAMTGDGVNDALAVSMADAGIAMGQAGTDVTKQAADLIITDDSFTSIVTGIREGRSLFLKIRMMIFFYLCINLAEALVYFGSSLIPNFALLDNWQRIFIFSMIHSFPAFGLIWDRMGREVMDSKPLDTSGIFNRKLAKALLLGAFSLTIMASLMYYVTYTGLIPVATFNKGGFEPSFLIEAMNAINWEHAKARTFFISTIIVSEATLVLSIRRMNQSFFSSLKSASWFVYFMVLLVPILHVILMYIPLIQTLLIGTIGINIELIQLTWYDWMFCVGAGLTPILVLELYKWKIRSQREFF